MDVISIRIRTACKPLGQSTAQHDKLAQGNLIRIFIFKLCKQLISGAFQYEDCFFTFNTSKYSLFEIASLHLIRRNILFFFKIRQGSFCQVIVTKTEPTFNGKILEWNCDHYNMSVIQKCVTGIGGECLHIFIRWSAKNLRKILKGHRVRAWKPCFLSTCYTSD